MLSGILLLALGVLGLGLVVFVHELGHFLMAKWRGVRVLRFSLGFGPKVWGFTQGGTEYRINAIPVGGYVQMAGDTPDATGDMPGAPDEFLSHHWFGRLLIVVAGPAANLIAGYVLFVIMAMTGVSNADYPSFVGPVSDTSTAYRAGLREGDRIVEVEGDTVSSWVPLEIKRNAVDAKRSLTLVALRGDQRVTITLPPDQREPFFSTLRPPADPPVVGGVLTGSPAYKAGLKERDMIVAVDGKSIRTWAELPQAIQGRVDKPIRLTVQRDGRTFEVVTTPIDSEGRRGARAGQIGIEAPRHGVYVERHGLIPSLQLAAGAVGQAIGSIYHGMWLIASRPLYYREYVGGPLFIVEAASQQARRGIDYYLNFIAYINIAIMAFNLLPLPVLDGGHILLAVIEAIRRQAISAKAYLRFQKAGLVVLGTLLVLILANDPLRIVQRMRAIHQQTPTTERPVAPATR
jgi:regulator of sigma E protease